MHGQGGKKLFSQGELDEMHVVVEVVWKDRPDSGRGQQAQLAVEKPEN